MTLCYSFILVLHANPSGVGTGKQVGKYCSCPCGPGPCSRGDTCKCPCKKLNRGCQDCQCCQRYNTCKDNCTCGDCTCKCCKDKDGGAISSVNAFTSRSIMIVLAFTGDGYLKTYSKYEHDRSKWPTKHFTTKKAFWYWYSSSVKGTYVTCMTSYTRDIRGTIIGKKEHLFIVYEDTPPEDDDPFFDLPFIKKKEEAECTPYPFVPPY